jgi:hypothetical protein
LGHNEATEIERDTLQLVFTGVAATVPTLTVLLGLVQNNSRFNSVDKRFDDLYRYIELRFNGMEKIFDAKLARLEEVMDARLKHLEER